MNITSAVRSLSSFRAAPRRGHLEQTKRVVVYPIKVKKASIKFRIALPDHSNLFDKIHLSKGSTQINVTEAIPYSCPTLLGKVVMLTHYVDVNILHYLLPEN